MELQNTRLLEDESLKTKAIVVLAIAMSTFQIFVALNPIHPWILYVAHLGFGLILATLCFPITKTAIGKALNITLFIIAISSTTYYIIQTDSILNRVGVAPTIGDIIFGVLLIVAVLEIARRTIGLALPIIAIVFIFYGVYGGFLPGFLGHSGVSWERLISYLVGQEGIYSIPLSTTARFVFLFVLFGALLQMSGAGKFFIDLAMSIAGGMKGGPAKIAVISSALFGTMSGASTTNVVTTGAFTIPLMKRIGYTPRYAGAVEAVASTGGQIMPPIMGSAAFILAEIVGIPYHQVIIAAIIPAILYFVAILVMVDIEADAKGLKGLPKSQLPKLIQLILKQGYLILPVVVIVLALLVFQLSATRVALWGIAATIFIILVRSRKLADLKKILIGFVNGAKYALPLIAAVACAGIVVGVLSITGTGLKFADAVISIAGENLPIALVLGMVASMVLGMGLPTTAAYLIGAAVVAPALVTMGVSPLAAHLFILYYASLSAITPPVGLAAFAAAGIANANPMGVALTSVKLGAVAYIIPFIFVYHETILAIGDPLNIIYSVMTAIIGVFCLGFGLQGWFFGQKANIYQRVLFIIASILLIIPEAFTDVIGILIVGAILLINYLNRRLKQHRNIDVNYQKKASK